MKKIQASELHDQTDEFDEDKKLISEDQLYPGKRIKTPIPDKGSKLPSAVELQNKGNFDVIDIIEESQNNLSNQPLIDQTGMSPYDSREENSRMQSAEPQRDSKIVMKKVKLAKSTDRSEQQDNISQINISSKEIMLPGEQMSTTPENQFFMKPGLAKSQQDKKTRLLKPERQSDFQGSEQINFQTSDAAFNEGNDVPAKTKRRERKTEITDSEEMEQLSDEITNASSKIEDQILKIATNELSSPKIKLSPFFDEDGVQKTLCRNLIQHPEFDQYYASSGEFGNQLRLFDVKNIEKGNHKFECMMRRVNICPTDLKEEQAKMRINLAEVYSFFRTVYDALEDQCPDLLKVYNDYKKKIENFDPKKSNFNINDINREFKKAKNEMKDIYINSFCLLGDDDGHIVVALNKLQKIILLKPTSEGPYIKVDEMTFDKKKKQSIVQVEAAADCYEVTHRQQPRQQFNNLLMQKRDELSQMNLEQNQKLSEIKKSRFELKKKFQERYYKVFVMHKSPIFQTVKLTYHLVAVDADRDENDGELFFLKESQYPDIYKYQEEEMQTNTNTNRQVKNEVNLRIGTSHMIINDEYSDSDSTKQELIFSIKSVGKIMQPCFEIRRFEDLSIKRHVKANFSASCILRDKDDIRCLAMASDQNVSLIKANFEQLQSLDSDRLFIADQKCIIKETYECFDGLVADQIINAGPYLILACMQKLTVVDKKLNNIVMQAETMGRIKCMTLSRDEQQLFIQTEDNYLYCILIEQISKITFKEPGTSEPIPYRQISKVVPTFVMPQQSKENLGSTIQGLVIAKGRQLWLHDKQKIYEKCQSIAYFPNMIQDITMDRECSRIFIIDEKQQLFVYIMETNSFRFLMEFQHNARMQLAYMPKYQPFDRAKTKRMRESFENQIEEEMKIKEEVHLLIFDGEDDDISLYRVHVPEVRILKELDENVNYGIYDSDKLRYWGPIKQPDMFKVISICYFEKTIFVLFQGLERETKFIRRFDEYFDRQQEVKLDFRMQNRQIEDFQLEDEAFMTQAGQYLILSYKNKTEYILEDRLQRRQINVFRTVDAECLEQGFVVLSFFDGALVASLSEEGHYVVIRDIDQNLAIFKQNLNFIPQQIIIDEQQQRIFVKESFGVEFDGKRFSQEFRQSFISNTKPTSSQRRSSQFKKLLKQKLPSDAVQDISGLGRFYEMSLGILQTKKNKDRQYNSLKKEMMRYQLHCATANERESYLLQENQFYTMVKMTANFVTITCCMGLKDQEMQQAISLGVPVVNDISGKSPIHFAKLTNNMVGLNLLVQHYQSQTHFTPITIDDRDLILQAYQPHWKQMFCFGPPIYFKEAQKLIANGFHGTIRANKEIIYTTDSEISRYDIMQSIVLEKDEDHEFTDTQIIEGQTLRIKLNMQIKTETCYNFLKLLTNSNSDLLVQSDLPLIIQHSYDTNYQIIIALNFIHILQTIVVVFKVTTENTFFQVLQIIMAVLIIFQQLHLIYQDDATLLESKLRLCSVIGNILAIVNSIAFSNIQEEYQWTNEQAWRNYFTCVMIIFVFIKGINCLGIFRQLRALVQIMNCCLSNLVHFILLLAIYVLMFASMEFVVDPFAYKDKRFFENFGERYRSVFGESSVIEYYYDSEGTVGWIIYFLFTIVVHIIMLNLLIHLVFDSYQKVRISQKSIETCVLIQMLLEVCIFQRVLKYLTVKKIKKILKGQFKDDEDESNEEEGKLYYVHRFISVCINQSEDELATTWQSKLNMLYEKQTNMLDRQAQLAETSSNNHKNILAKINDFDSLIESQTIDIFKRIESQNAKTFTLIQKQLATKSDGALLSQPSFSDASKPSSFDANGMFQQILSQQKKLFSEMQQNKEAIISQLDNQQKQINDQNSQIIEMQSSLKDQFTQINNQMNSITNKDEWFKMFNSLVILQTNKLQHSQYYCQWIRNYINLSRTQELRQSTQYYNQLNESLSVIKESINTQQLQQQNNPVEQIPQKQSNESDELKNEQIKEEISSLNQSLKIERQNSQSQISDVKNQIDQVVRKMSYLENAINEMKESKENLANSQERLKDDIQNMLFDQKHQILGSISQIMNKNKSESNTQLDQFDLGLPNVEEDENQDNKE